MATINITDITNGNVQGIEWVGTGIFDVLMNAVNKNIDIQYQNGRITGSDYANVYLSSIQAVLQQSITFVLQKQISETDTALKKEQERLTYVERIIKDKKAAEMGLDVVVKAANSAPENVYTPKYYKV